VGAAVGAAAITVAAGNGHRLRPLAAAKSAAPASGQSRVLTLRRGQIMVRLRS